MNMLNIKHAACIFIKCNIFTYKMLRVTQQPNIGHRHSSPWHKMYLCQKADIFYTVGPVHSVQYISHASSHCTVWLVSGSLVTSWFLTSADQQYFRTVQFYTLHATDASYCFCLWTWSTVQTRRVLLLKSMQGRNHVKSVITKLAVGYLVFHFLQNQQYITWWINFKHVPC